MSEDTNAAQEPGTEQAPQASAQDRINRLTRQKHDARREVETLQAQNAELAGNLQSLQAQVAQLTQAPAPAQPAPLSPFGTPQTPQAPVAPSGVMTPADIQRAVAEAVGQAVAPLHDMVSANQRGTAQQQTFSELAREDPALADPNSDLHKAFQQVWDGNHELQALENGLELAVFAAKGAVGGTPAVPADAAKAAAAVTPPKTSPQNLLPTEVDDVGKAKELAGALEKKGAEQGLNDGEWQALLAASLGSQTPQ